LEEIAASGNGLEDTKLQLKKEEYRSGPYYSDGDAGRVRASKEAIASGESVFGRVEQISESQAWLHYYAFLAWDETAFSEGFGNHEGDWLCAQLLVNLQSNQIVAMILHNHGRQLQLDVQQSDNDARILDLSEDGHPILYLEMGTNELWPNRGFRGWSGWPTSRIKTNELFDDGEGFGSEHKIVREHLGKAQEKFYTTGHVTDLTNSNSDAAKLVLQYQGKWGGWWKNYPTGDVASPRSPRWQVKMWQRQFDAPSLTPPKNMSSNNDWIKKYADNQIPYPWPRPPINTPRGTFVLFHDKNFGGDPRFYFNIQDVPEDQLILRPANFHDAASSGQWDLSEGVVVILYENINGTGKQITLEGKNQQPNFRTLDFNDKFDSWRWKKKQ
jgi:hypothetical protein